MVLRDDYSKADPAWIADDELLDLVTGYFPNAPAYFNGFKAAYISGDNGILGLRLISPDSKLFFAFCFNGRAPNQMSVDISCAVRLENLRLEAKSQRKKVKYEFFDRRRQIAGMEVVA